MQSVSSRIWTRVAVSISYDDNDYTTGTYFFHRWLIQRSPTIWWGRWRHKWGQSTHCWLTAHSADRRSTPGVKNFHCYILLGRLHILISSGALESRMCRCLKNGIAFSLSLLYLKTLMHIPFLKSPLNGWSKVNM